MHTFDEMVAKLPYGGLVDHSQVRAHYQAYAQWLAGQSTQTMAHRREEA